MKNSEELNLQQQRFCDEYLVSFNAFRAALSAGYSESKARKADLLHEPKIQAYLKMRTEQRRERLEISHDRILRELAKVAFSNMGDYYDDRCALKPMYALTSDEKAALSYYQVCDAYDEEGNRRGEFGKIRLHNKMSALEKIARHTGFYSKEYQVSSIKYQDELKVVSGELPVASFEEKVAVAVEEEVVNGELCVAGLKEEVLVEGKEAVAVEQERKTESLKDEGFKEEVAEDTCTTGETDTNVEDEIFEAEKNLTFSPLSSDIDHENEVGKILTFSPLPPTQTVIDESVKVAERPRHWLALGNG